MLKGRWMLFFVPRAECCKGVYSLSPKNAKWGALTRIAHLAEE
jgi:hypothetical protein